MSEESSGAEPADRSPGGPGRYSRTTNGLIGSMIVTVLVVVAFVAFRGLVSKDLDVEPDRVDYLETVLGLQASGGFSPVYPEAIPEDWQATNVSFDPAADRPSFGLSLLTGDERYVGVRQEDAAVDDLLEELVEGDVTAGEPYASTTDVAAEWDTWTAAGGDHAFTAAVGEDTVVVFGSAPVDQLEDVVDSLTTAPLATPSAAPSSSPTR